MTSQEEIEFIDLLKKYQAGEATPEQVEFIERYYTHFEKLPDPSGSLNKQQLAHLKSDILLRIKKEIHSDPNVHISAPGNSKRFKYWLAAASVIFLFSGYFFIKQGAKVEVSATVGKPNIMPGGSKAILTLSGGQTIILDSSSQHSTLTQGSVSLVNKNGLLAYTSLHEKPNEILFNQVSTPRGGQYHITLSDGTNVWLNAASSIRYPVFFSSAERKVELQGEAYFEVAKDAAHPFLVASGNSTVEVLGTHFNVNSYSNEQSSRITLLEGSVLVKDSGFSAKLVPGEQAEVGQDNRIQINKGVDLENVIAWKNGFFQFDNADIQSIMRQIGRWYDVDIIYEGNISRLRFDGIISRNSSLNDVLKIMEIVGIKFKIHEKKIIVTS